MTYTWTRVRYGPLSHQWAEWGEPSGHTPGVSADLPTLVYVAGGMVTAHAATPPSRAPWDGTRTAQIYNASSASVYEPLFSAATSGLNTQEDMVIFSINTARGSYNYRDAERFSAWSGASGTYNVDDIVRGLTAGHTDHVYRCVAQHNPATVTAAVCEPHIGTSWQLYWEHSSLADIALAYQTKGSQTPGYGSSGVLDVQLAIQYVRESHELYGLNGNVVLMGEGGGGVHAACAAYSVSASYHDLGTPGSAGLFTRSYPSRPDALVIRDTATDFRNYTAAARHYTLFGRITSAAADWNNLSDEVKSALSPTAVLGVTQLLVPTYMIYRATRHNDAASSTVYGTGNPYQHAKNGWDHLTYVEAIPGYNAVLVEDSSTGGLLDRYTSTSSSTTISDTDTAIATDITNWIDSALP